ncbi:hypothetical protein CDAR_73821 [Caerostris darwini]|uniref:Uncharacterized protein n=1 Tax=Caerostris darwini TaxID=1538125 RepID=A0AAV4MQK0_9ARAC|nr:hypothetical protein CDAR_73821 [Caerostris darwini]
MERSLFRSTNHVQVIRFELFCHELPRVELRSQDWNNASSSTGCMTQCARKKPNDSFTKRDRFQFPVRSSVKFLTEQKKKSK